MDIVIYHNPRCSKSRETLQLLQEAGFDPEIVEYQKIGWRDEALRALFVACGVSAKEALRAKTAPAPELGLSTASEEEVIAAMVAHPVLVERPIVVAGGQGRICRPPERVWEVVPKP